MAYGRPCLGELSDDNQEHKCLERRPSGERVERTLHAKQRESTFPITSVRLNRRGKRDKRRCGFPVGTLFWDCRLNCKVLICFLYPGLISNYHLPLPLVPGELCLSPSLLSLITNYLDLRQMWIQPASSPPPPIDQAWICTPHFSSLAPLKTRK